MRLITDDQFLDYRDYLLSELQSHTSRSTQVRIDALDGAPDVPDLMIRCPICYSPEVGAMTPRTVYACGSSDYDQRPGTFVQSESCFPAKRLLELQRYSPDCSTDSTMRHSAFMRPMPDVGDWVRLDDIRYFFQETEWKSADAIGEAAGERFDELAHKGWDWSSFYNGFLEGATARPPGRRTKPKDRTVSSLGSDVLGDHNKPEDSNVQGLSETDYKSLTGSVVDGEERLS